MVLSNFDFQILIMIDTHAHLMFPEFKGEIPEILERARVAGIEKIVNVGCSAEFSRRAVELANEYENLYATVGLHPYDVKDLSEELMEEWANLIRTNKKILAIGEIGLDYFKAQVPKDVQKIAFRRQLKLAQEVKLPVVIHNREADEDCFEILREFPDIRAVFHCYGSGIEFARKLWDAGYSTSFTGIITYPNARGLREIVSEVPLNGFFVETDCPYLAPQKYRGERNEPSYVNEVAKQIAAIRGIPFKEVDRISTKNAEEFFRL